MKAVNEYLVCAIVLILCLSGCDRRGEQLLKAAGEGDVSLVQQLLDDGQDPNIVDENGFSPLALATLERHVECVRVLLRAGADPGFPSSLKSALSVTVHGNGDVLDLILEHESKLPDETPELVLSAAAHLNYPVLRVLMKHGAHVGNVDALLAAVYRPNIFENALDMQAKCVSFLLNAGAPVNAMGSAEGPLVGFTPLEASAMSNNWAIARLLLERGADPEMQSPYGGTACTMARGLGFVQYCDKLREWQEEVRTTDLLKEP